MKPKIFAIVVALASLGITGPASACSCNTVYFYNFDGFIYPEGAALGPNAIANIDLTVETFIPVSAAGTPIENVFGSFSYTGPNFSLAGSITGPDPAGINILLLGQNRVDVTNVIYQGEFGPVIQSIAFTVGQYAIALVDPPSFDTLVVYPNLSDYENDVSPLLYANVVVETATPLPAALPLFASGLGALGFFGWPRNRRAQSPEQTITGEHEGPLGGPFSLGAREMALFCCVALWSLLALSVISRQRSKRSLSGV